MRRKKRKRKFRMLWFKHEPSLTKYTHTHTHTKRKKEKMLLTFTASSSLKRSISRSIFPTNVRRLPGGGWRDAPDGKNKCVCQKRQNSSGSDLEIVSPCRVGNGEKHRVAGTRAIYRADLAQRRTSTRSKSIEGAIYRQLCGIYWHNSQETTARVNRWPQLSSDCTNR